MTEETYKKATKLLNQIEYLTPHLLAMEHKQTAEHYPITYPFTFAAREEGIRPCLPREILDKFLLDYKEALVKKIESLKEEFAKL